MKVKILYATTWNEEKKKTYKIWIYALIDPVTGEGKKISKEEFLD